MVSNSALRYLRGFTRDPLTSHLKSDLFRSAAKFRLVSTTYLGLFWPKIMSGGLNLYFSEEEVVNIFDSINDSRL